MSNVIAQDNESGARRNRDAASLEVDQELTTHTHLNRYPDAQLDLRDLVKTAVEEQFSASPELNKICLEVGASFKEKIEQGELSDIDAFVLFVFRFFNSNMDPDSYLLRKLWMAQFPQVSATTDSSKYRSLRSLFDSADAAFQEWEERNRRFPTTKCTFFEFASSRSKNTFYFSKSHYPFLQSCPNVLASAAALETLSSERYKSPFHLVSSEYVLCRNDDLRTPQETEYRLSAESYLSVVLCVNHVNIMSGENDRGKTTCALSMARPDDVLIYCTPRRASSVSISAFNLLVELLASAVGHDVDKIAAKRISSEEYLLNRHNGNATYLWNPAVRVPDSPSKRIFIVLDEFNDHVNFIHQLCEIWVWKVQPWLSRRFGVDSRSIYLTVAGNGLETFRTPSHGSRGCSHIGITVITSRIFARTLLHLRTVPKWKNLADSLIALLYDETTTTDWARTTTVALKRKPADSNTERFLKLVLDCPRCASIAFELIEHDPSMEKTASLDAQNLRSFLPEWAEKIESHFLSEKEERKKIPSSTES